MFRFSLNNIFNSNNNKYYTNNFNYNTNINNTLNSPKINYFNESKNFYICSFGGCGSTVLHNYLSNFGNVFHIHDRYPPNKLKYVGNNNTTEDVYSEWFNNVEIPEDEVKNYNVIYIYRNPIDVIYSRFAQRHGPNVNHLKNIMCENGGNINIFDVLKSGRDLYKIEEFFDNYTIPKERNYNIYCVKYEMFWNNIQLFNKIIGIPDIKELYPIKNEKIKSKQFYKQLLRIYERLILKMNRMRYIEIV
jgi:hypothetical protein